MYKNFRHHAFGGQRVELRFQSRRRYHRRLASRLERSASRAQAVHGALVSKRLHNYRFTRFEENIINEIECLP